MSLLDSTVISGLIGAFSAWALTYFTEKSKIKKRKKSISIIIKSEIKLNLFNIMDFKKLYFNLTAEEYMMVAH